MTTSNAIKVLKRIAHYTIPKWPLNRLNTAFVYGALTVISISPCTPEVPLARILAAAAVIPVWLRAVEILWGKISPFSTGYIWLSLKSLWPGRTLWSKGKGDD